jgi:hypothetical protein
MNVYEVLLVEKVYGTIKVTAKTEEQAQHLALRSREIAWENPSNVEVVAVMVVRGD